MRIYTVKGEGSTEYWGDVTDIFVDFLGSVVKSAKIKLYEDYGCGGVSKKDIKSMGERVEKVYAKNKVLQCDASTVVVTFKNDKSIRIMNSEWCSIESERE